MKTERVEGRINVIRDKKRVAIVGFAPTWPMAPFKDPEVEIWGLNESHMIFPRIDVLFELHGRKEIEQKERDKEKQQHLNWLRAAKIPLFMQQHYEDIPNSIPYPREWVQKTLGERCLGPGQQETYFTNSISWEIALAILLGFEEILLYGVNMANDEEYASQRPSVEYFIGMARGAGIKVFVPDQSDICKSWTLYGFDDELSSSIAKRVKHFIDENQGKRQQLQATVESEVATLHQHIGMLQAAGYFMKAFFYPNAGQNELLTKETIDKWATSATTPSASSPPVASPPRPTAASNTTDGLSTSRSARASRGRSRPRRPRVSVPPPPSPSTTAEASKSS